MTKVKGFLVGLVMWLGMVGVSYGANFFSEYTNHNMYTTMRNAVYSNITLTTYVSPTKSMYSEVIDVSDKTGVMSLKCQVEGSGTLTIDVLGAYDDGKSGSPKWPYFTRSLDYQNTGPTDYVDPILVGFTSSHGEVTIPFSTGGVNYIMIKVTETGGSAGAGLTYRGLTNTFGIWRQ